MFRMRKSFVNFQNTKLAVVTAALPFLILGAVADAQLPGEGPALADINITQEQIETGQINLVDLRRIGRQIFSTPFNNLDGLGDGPHNPLESASSFGNRPTLQGNGTFLRVNGLDSQSCLECHFALSTAAVPMTFGVGGFGGANAAAMFGPTVIDVADTANAGIVTFNGRFINPPFVFGAGGIELLGKEMTQDLQDLKQFAMDNENVEVELLTKGISFGTIVYEGGALNLDSIEGIDDDLVVRPFGRKGCCATTRGFDLGAFQFHMGIQAVEAVGVDNDADNDGVANELLVGELSAVAIFNTTLERPVTSKSTTDSRKGAGVFEAIGCAECHVPELTTNSPFLNFSFPEDDTHPYENVYYQVNLSKAPTNFDTYQDGISVPLLSDLKRHDMGLGLAESFGSALDSQFITAKLWGVADSAPYLHDGRALTIGEAISLHAGEAEDARDAYLALSESDTSDLLTFLQTLRTPSQVGGDLDGNAKKKVKGNN